MKLIAEPQSHEQSCGLLLRSAGAKARSTGANSNWEHEVIMVYSNMTSKVLPRIASKSFGVIVMFPTVSLIDMVYCSCFKEKQTRRSNAFAVLL